MLNMETASEAETKTGSEAETKTGSEAETKTETETATATEAETRRTTQRETDTNSKSANTKGYTYALCSDMYRFYGDHVVKVGRATNLRRWVNHYTKSYVKPVEVAFVQEMCKIVLWQNSLHS